MASVADEFWDNVRAEIRAHLEPYLPFLADVVAVTNGQVQIQAHDEEAPYGVASAREAGLALSVGDVVLAQRVAGGSVVVRQRVQTSAPGPQSVEGGLAAANVTGTLDAATIPNLPASRIASGTLAVARIPALDAAQIASGLLDAARIPALDAGQITTGTFGAGRIPNLDAGKVTTGTFAAARIPALPYAATSDGDKLVYNDTDSADNADTVSTTATSGYVQGYQKTITLPAGTWRCVFFGGIVLSRDVGGGQVVVRAKAGATTTGDKIVGYAVANERLAAFAGMVQTGQSGSFTYQIDYGGRGAAGTTVADNPWLSIVAVRTG